MYDQMTDTLYPDLTSKSKVFYGMLLIFVHTWTFSQKSKSQSEHFESHSMDSPSVGAPRHMYDQMTDTLYPDLTSKSKVFYGMLLIFVHTWTFSQKSKSQSEHFESHSMDSPSVGAPRHMYDQM